LLGGGKVRGLVSLNSQNSQNSMSGGESSGGEVGGIARNSMQVHNPGLMLETNNLNSDSDLFSTPKSKEGGSGNNDEANNNTDASAEYGGPRGFRRTGSLGPNVMAKAAQGVASNLSKSFNKRYGFEIHV
jgi:hypothetical protein